MSVTARTYTYDDLANTPDDGQRYEIIGGELLVSPSPILSHQRVVTRLGSSLNVYVLAEQLGEVFVGPTDVYISEDNVVVPDIVFVSRQRSDILRRLYIAGAPDLVIEVLSNRTRRRDLGVKKALYAAAGVAEYWVVDPAARTIMVWMLVDGEYQPVEQADDTVRSHVVPGYEVAVADVFAIF